MCSRELVRHWKEPIRIYRYQHWLSLCSTLTHLLWVRLHFLSSDKLSMFETTTQSNLLHCLCWWVFKTMNILGDALKRRTLPSCRWCILGPWRSKLTCFLRPRRKKSGKRRRRRRGQNSLYVGCTNMTQYQLYTGVHAWQFICKPPVGLAKFWQTLHFVAMSHIFGKLRQGEIRNWIRCYQQAEECASWNCSVHASAACFHSASGCMCQNQVF